MTYLFFDTETTGLPKDFNIPYSESENWPRLVQLAYILADENAVVLHQGSWIIKPKDFRIPSDASAVHGITDEIANVAGWQLSQVLTEFNTYIEQADMIVCHNTSYDINVLMAEYFRSKIHTTLISKLMTCTMRASVKYCNIPGPTGKPKFPKLMELHEKLFETKFEGAHNAIADVAATALCFYKLMSLNII